MPQPARTPDTIADALRYYGDKLDLRKRLERTLSLDPQEGDLGDTAVDIAGGFIPGVSQALAVRDIERARRANDLAGMALASTGLIPGGKLADLLKKRGPIMQEIGAYHELPHIDNHAVETFNKSAKIETDLANKRVSNPDEAHSVFNPISSIEELDQIDDPMLFYSKAKALQAIGQKSGFKTSIESSNVSPSVYVKFSKPDENGLYDFKVRISDHADVSRNKPAGEIKAYDINPESTGSMSELINLLQDQKWLKQFYSED